MAGMCRAQTEALQRSIAEDFYVIEDAEEVVTREVDNLSKYTAEDLGKAASAIPFIKDYILAVEKQLNTRLHNGVPVPGWKLVLGRAGNAKWVSEDAAIRKLIENNRSLTEIFDFGLIPPTTAKKRWGKRNADVWGSLESLVTRSDGKPNAVPEHDPRPAWVPVSCVDDFETTEEGG